MCLLVQVPYAVAENGSDDALRMRMAFDRDVYYYSGVNDTSFGSCAGCLGPKQ